MPYRELKSGETVRTGERITSPDVASWMITRWMLSAERSYDLSTRRAGAEGTFLRSEMLVGDTICFVRHERNVVAVYLRCEIKPVSDPAC